MSKRWRIHSHDPDRITTLGARAGIPAVVAQLLVSRGVTEPSAAREFLDPKLADLRDPQLLPNCTEAAALIHQAVRAGKRICIHGDYDVDGMTGDGLALYGIETAGGRRGLLYPPPAGRRLRAERRDYPRESGGKSRSDRDGRLRHRQRGRSGACQATRHRFDYHRPSRAGPETARRRGHCPPPPARRRISVRGPERIGSGFQIGLGDLPAIERGQESRRCDEGFFAPGRGSGRPWHCGRRRAAGR